MKTLRKTLTPPQKMGAALVGCALATGCPGPKTRVRPTPPPADCPADAVKTMNELDPRQHFISVSLGRSGGRIITVSEGSVMVTTYDDAGKLVAGSTLSGQLLFAPSRVYGRFTRARLSSGEVFPVCYEFVHYEEPGAIIEQKAPEPDLARIFSTQHVWPVDRFH